MESYSDAKESACNVGDLGLIPGLGRCPGEGNGSPFQFPCLENFRDRGAWQGTFHGAAKSQTRLRERAQTVRDGNELLQWWVIRKVVVVGGGGRKNQAARWPGFSFFLFF